MCSVVTNLVTSLEFQPIRCATTLFHFGRTRYVYVATRIILLSSTLNSLRDENDEPIYTYTDPFMRNFVPKAIKGGRCNAFKQNC